MDTPSARSNLPQSAFERPEGYVFVHMWTCEHCVQWVKNSNVQDDENKHWVQLKG